MAQQQQQQQRQTPQYPPAGAGGRGGGGRGGGQQQQQPPPSQQQRPMGAWQPAAPTSLQMAAAAGGAGGGAGAGAGGGAGRGQQPQQAPAVAQPQQQVQQQQPHPMQQQQQQQQQQLQHQQQPMQYPSSYGYTVPSQQYPHHQMNPYATYNPYMTTAAAAGPNQQGYGYNPYVGGGRGGGGGGRGGSGGGGHSWNPTHPGGGGRGGSGGGGGGGGGGNGGNPYAGAADAAARGSNGNGGGNNSGNTLPYHQPAGGMYYSTTPPGAPPGARPVGVGGPGTATTVPGTSTTMTQAGPSATVAVPPPPPQPRTRKALTITDKDGNPIDLSGTMGAKKAAAAAAAAATAAVSTVGGSGVTGGTAVEAKATAATATAATTATVTVTAVPQQQPMLLSPPPPSDAGAKLRQAALDAIRTGKKARRPGTSDEAAAAPAEGGEEAMKKKHVERPLLSDETTAAKKDKATEEAAEAAATATAPATSKKEEEEKAQAATAAAAAAAAQEEATPSGAKNAAPVEKAEEKEKIASGEEDKKKDAVRSSISKAPRSTLASLLSKQGTAGKEAADDISRKMAAASIGGGGPPPATTAPTDSTSTAATTATTAASSSSSSTAKSINGSKKRHVYSKDELMRLRDLPVCMQRPDDLPEFVITNGPSRGGGGGGSGGAGGDREGREARRGAQRNSGPGGGGGGSDWQRGAAPPPRRASQPKEGGLPGNAVNTPPAGGGGSGNNGNANFGNDGGGQWTRGQAPPPPPPQRAPNQGGRGGGGGRGGRGGGGGGRGGQGPPFFDGPVAPLVKSNNGWRPRKETSSLVVAEKKVKSILNKMTKENFGRLADQMCEIPVTSHDILTMMISNVYEKAIDEPSFGEIYGDLCVRLSQHVQSNSFVKVIESDEEPPTEDGEEPAAGGSSVGAASSYIVYRWSNDVSTSDSEIVGPFGSADECMAMALSSETQQEPTNRGDMELELVKLQIKNGVFVKIMTKKAAAKKVVTENEEGEVKEDEAVAEEFYTVFFPVSDHVECGQQLSKIFLSDRECVSDANKQNSFKRSLLNKCEDEFNKQDIYVDWKKDKVAYEGSKGSLSASEQAEKEEELNFRRIKIKKQMLGNIKFIGQLYKKNLLKEKIMRFCIASLLKLETKDSKSKLPVYYDTGDTDMDEEDHEALCSMFSTIGKTIDAAPAADFMKICFNKIDKLSDDEGLPMRSRFMYKDLLELRRNEWVPRRTELKVKTLEEIRKEVEREERLQAQQSAQQGGGGNYRGGGGGGGRNDYGGGGGGRGGGGGGGDFRSSNRPTSYASNSSNIRARPGKQTEQTDDDGFTTIVGGSSIGVAGGGKPRSSLAQAAQQPQRILQKGGKPGFSSLAEAADLSMPASSPSMSSSVPPLDDEKFERRVKTVRMEFMADPSNLTELMLSIDGLTGTENFGSKFVSMNADRIIDSKEDERKAVYSLLSVLVEKKRLSSDDVKKGLTELIEFIDSYIYDAPRAFDYLGELLSNMIRVKAIDATWVGEQAEKTKTSDESNPEKIIRALMCAIKSAGGSDAVKGAFGVHQKKMEAVLGTEKWAAMKQEVA